MSIAAITAARTYGFAGHYASRFGDAAQTQANANAAYAELDAYGSGSSPTAPATSVAPPASSASAAVTSAPASISSDSSDDSSGSDFLGQLGSSLGQAAEGVLIGAVGGLTSTGAPAAAPAPVVNPPQLYLGLPAPVWIIGLGFLWLSTK